MKEIKHFTEPKTLKILRFVCETGGKSVKIKWSCTGIESFVFGAILFNKLQLTNKGVINVFDNETKEWLGYIKRGKYDIPTRYAPEYPATFADFYQEAE